MPKFLTPIDLSNLEVRNVLLQNLPTVSLPATNRAGQILYDSTVNRPKWNNGSGFFDIFRADTANTVDTVVLRGAGGNFSAGTITATLSGNASTATTLQTARDFSITGKGTAAAVSFNGSGNVALNLTALSVVPGDITLANNLFIVGNSSGVGAATAKNLIAISGFGAATADVAMGGFKITGLGDPTAATDAATKGYVDSTAQGLDPKESCRIATVASLNATYTSGNQRLTGNTNGSITIDSVPIALGNRILVKNQSTASQNGIYVVTQLGDAYTPYILTRASDFNTSAKASPGSFTFIEEGLSQSDTGWVMSSNSAVTLDTTDINWVQFSGAGSYTAGRGLVLSGTVFHFAQSTAYTVGDLPYASGPSTIGLLAASATGNALISGGAGAAPTWGKIDLSTHISGTLGVSNGGTGATTLTANGVLLGNGTSAVSAIAPSAIAQILVAGSTSIPAWVSMTGDVQIGSTGITAIGANKVLDTMLRQGSATSVIGRSSNSAGNVADITASADGQFLRRAGGVLGFGQLVSASTITGDGSATAFVVTHNLGTRDVIIAVNESTSPYARVYTDDEATSTTTATIRFAVAPTNGTAYRVVVVGF
jgi:hypothetical protein